MQSGGWRRDRAWRLRVHGLVTLAVVQVVRRWSAGDIGSQRNFAQGRQGFDDVCCSGKLKPALAFGIFFKDPGFDSSASSAAIQEKNQCVCAHAFAWTQ